MLPKIVIVDVYKYALCFIIIVYVLLTLLGCVGLRGQNTDESFCLMLSILAMDRPPKQKKETLPLILEGS